MALTRSCASRRQLGDGDDAGRVKSNSSHAVAARGPGRTAPPHRGTWHAAAMGPAPGGRQVATYSVGSGCLSLPTDSRFPLSKRPSGWRPELVFRVLVKLAGGISGCRDFSPSLSPLALASLWFAHFAQVRSFAHFGMRRLRNYANLSRLRRDCPEISNSDAPSCSSGRGCHQSFAAMPVASLLLQELCVIDLPNRSLPF